MITPELRTYLLSLRDLPVAPRPEELRAVLSSVGWDEQSIIEGIDFFFAPEVVPENTGTNPPAFIDNTIPPKEDAGVIPVTKQGEETTVPVQAEAVADSSLRSDAPTFRMMPFVVDTSSMIPSMSSEPTMPPVQSVAFDTKPYAHQEGGLSRVGVTAVHSAPQRTSNTLIDESESLSGDSIVDESNPSSGFSVPEKLSELAAAVPVMSASVVPTQTGASDIAQGVVAPPTSPDLVPPADSALATDAPKAPFQKTADAQMPAEFFDATVTEKTAPAPLHFATSQSMLYPDNSSRLGFRGEAGSAVSGEPVAASPVAEIPVAPTSAQQNNAVDYKGKGSDAGAGIQESVPVSEKGDAYAFAPLADISFRSEPRPSVRVASNNTPPRSDVRPSVPAKPIVLPRVPIAPQRTPAPTANTAPEARVRMSDVRPVRAATMEGLVKPPTRQEMASRGAPQEGGIMYPASLRHEEKAVVSSVTSVKVPARRFRLSRLVILIPIILGIGAALVYAYVVGGNSFAFQGPYTSETFVKDFIAGMNKIETAKIKGSLSAAVMNRGAAGEPLVLPQSTTTLAMLFAMFDPASPDFLKFIAPDSGASMSYEVLVDRKNSSATVNTTGSFEAVVSFQGATHELAVDMISSDGGYFMRLQKIPDVMVPIDLKDVLGKWIRVEEGFQALVGSQFMVTTVRAPSVQMSAEQTTLLIETLLESAMAENVFSIQKAPRREALLDKTVYRYVLSVSAERMGPFLRRVGNTLRVASSTDLAFLALANGFSEAGASMEKPFIAERVAYILRNATIDIVADAEGVPQVISWTLPLIPGANVTQLADKQISVVFSLSASAINSPIQVTAPSAYISMEEAHRLILGLSLQQYHVVQQIERVTALREALSLHQSFSGEYPATLKELEQTGKQIMQRAGKKETVSDFSFYYDGYTDTPLSEAVPLQASSSEAFGYKRSVDGRDYTITYNIDLPNYQPNILSHIFYIPSDPKKISLVVVHGSNRATSHTFSIEALDASFFDTDADGVSDSTEVYMGTNIRRADSDGDGVKDAQEIRASAETLLMR